MLVWRILKRSEKTGDNQIKPRQGRPRTTRTLKQVKSTREKIRRNPKRSVQNLARVKCVVWNHVNCCSEEPEDVSIQACQETPTFCSSCCNNAEKKNIAKMQYSSFPHSR